MHGRRVKYMNERCMETGKIDGDNVASDALVWTSRSAGVVILAPVRHQHIIEPNIDYIYTIPFGLLL